MANCCGRNTNVVSLKIIVYTVEKYIYPVSSSYVERERPLF